MDDIVPRQLANQLRNKKGLGEKAGTHAFLYVNPALKQRLPTRTVEPTSQPTTGPAGRQREPEPQRDNPMFPRGDLTAAEEEWLSKPRGAADTPPWSYYLLQDHVAQVLELCFEKRPSQEPDMSSLARNWLRQVQDHPAVVFTVDARGWVDETRGRVLGLEVSLRVVRMSFKTDRSELVDPVQADCVDLVFADRARGFAPLPNAPADFRSDAYRNGVHDAFRSAFIDAMASGLASSLFSFAMMNASAWDVPSARLTLRSPLEGLSNSRQAGGSQP